VKTRGIRTGAAASLPDGVRIREASPADRDQLAEFIAALSPQSRHNRFFITMTRPAEPVLRMLCGTPGTDAIVATSADMIIGHVMVIDSLTPAGLRSGDAGIVVADAWHSRGVGTALALTVAARAASRGVTALTADIRPANEQALSLISRLSPHARITRQDGQLHAVIPLGTPIKA